MSAPITPYLEISQAIQEVGGEALRKCYQCGTCTGTCPWSPITHFNIRQLIRQGIFGLEGIEEFMWHCSTCNHCVSVCPRGVEIIDVVRAVRRVYSEGGLLPESLRVFVGGISSRGNPWSGDPGKRNDWAQEQFPLFTEGTEYLYFTCCTLCYDPRNVQVAKATAALLTRAGLSWGLPSTDVLCCGESIGKVGDTMQFERLQGVNEQFFQEHGVSKIIVNSPHCLYAFKKEYPGTYEVIHTSELLAGLLKNGTLKPTKDLGGITVTYHDPCYLGRHNGVYDAPREILQSLPGVNFVEMARSREQGYCCGGGGGGLWTEREKGERLSDLRIEEALGTGASVIATACPYCISMLEDSVKTANADDKIQVKDLVELVVTSLE
ncbi:MAG: (Fe-S)-binding protein [Deltaproteobacteria bacterium]|nr:(Fe-S)-binding protein [Deltaproteobacteria bacterium]